MTRWLLILVVAILSMAGARRAEACTSGQGNDDALVAMLVIGGGAYAAATVGFGVADLVGKDHSTAYGIVETAIHAPLALGFGIPIWDRLQRPSGGHDGVALLTTLTLLHTTLALHGIYTMVRADERKHREKSAARRPPRPRAAFGPALIPDGAGLGYGGTF